MGQSWVRLLFAHWRVPADMLLPHVPPGLSLDELDGSAWLGVVPFEVVALRPRFGLPVPGVSRFTEVNVRTYVTVAGRPGVLFLSLNTPNRLAVMGGRRGYALPYHRASIALDAQGDRVRVEGVGLAGQPGSALSMSYRPAGPVRVAAPGSLEHSLTERYRFYTVARPGHPRSTDVHHLPWPLQDADVRIDELRGFLPDGVEVRGAPQLVHYSAGTDVVVWPPRR